jgi:hypothetical protein
VDLRFLRELTETPGPFATVYLDVSHDTADAARAVEQRWSQARAQLAEQGADAATLDALASAVDAGPPPVGRAGRVLVACAGKVLLDRRMPDPPPTVRASWGRLPDLLPLLTVQPEPVTAVVVRVDETGGEIYLAGPEEEPEPVEHVEGSEFRVHKVRGGGWSHLAMQERVEESWRRNTAEVAERVDRQVAGTAAQVLVVAGDPRNRSRLIDALGERSAAIAVQVEHTGGRSTDREDLAAAVAEAVQDVATAARHAVLERYDQAAGRPDGLGVDGLARVLAAFRAEAVDTLLIDAAVPRARPVWISDAPSQIAMSEEELQAEGATSAGQAPADAALLRAAAATGAAFVVVGGGEGTGVAARPLADGVGALLRYPLPTGA